MPETGRCKVHGGKSTGPRTPEGLERSRRANWKHGRFSREAKAERLGPSAFRLHARFQHALCAERDGQANTLVRGAAARRASGENAIRLQRARFIHSTTVMTVVCGWCARAQGVHCSFSTIPPPSLAALPLNSSGSPSLRKPLVIIAEDVEGEALATLVLYVPNGTDKQPQRRARASRRALAIEPSGGRDRVQAIDRETSSPRLTSYLLPASTAVQHPRPSRAGHASVRIGLALSAARSAHRRILAGTGPLCRASFPRPAPVPNICHAERSMQSSRRQEYRAANAGGPRAQQASELETRALFAGSQGGTTRAFSIPPSCTLSARSMCRTGRTSKYAGTWSCSA